MNIIKVFLMRAVLLYRCEWVGLVIVGAYASWTALRRRRRRCGELSCGVKWRRYAARVALAAKCSLCGLWQDLERQVRLRLGLGLRRRERNEQGEEVESLTRYQNTTCRHEQLEDGGYSEIDEELTRVAGCVPVEKEGEGEREGVRKEGEDSQRRRRGEGKRGRECPKLPSISLGDRTSLYRYLSKSVSLY